jgi:1-acyl-sn-glycerol-3-phosphate acyltransferase
MLRFLPVPIVGTLTTILVVTNVVVLSMPVLALALLSLLVPIPAWRRLCMQVMVWLCAGWISINNLIFAFTMGVEWELRGSGYETVTKGGRYLVVSNHQSWADVMTLQRGLGGHIPFLRFFIKQELIYIPVLGLVWWALGMPFMKRYSAAYLAKHPEKKGQDLETTRKACERYREGPISIMNFIEGTRFTKRKRDRQESPYAHLLKPRAGGVASVLDAFQGELSTLVDVTIVYPGKTPTIWEFFSGQVHKVIIDMETVGIPAEIRTGDYAEDPAYRERVQDWVSELWAKKDRKLAVLQGADTATPKVSSSAVG